MLLPPLLPLLPPLPLLSLLPLLPLLPLLLLAPPPTPYKATIKYDLEEVDKPPKAIAKHGHH